MHPATIVGHVSGARQWYAWLAAAGYRPDNPAALLPAPPAPRRIPRPIGEDQLAAAMQAAPERVRPWLVLAGWCGLRAKEIALLRAENVHPDASPPYLIVAADATKGRRERTVPLAPFVVAELAAARLPASGYLFRRHDGAPGPNAPGLVSQLAARALRDAGVSATLHQLRHRFGTRTYQASHDIRVVQELMGHQSPVTTAAYTACGADAAIAAVTALAAFPGIR